MLHGSDQQSVLFQSTRIAPVQICFFVRGSTCPGDKIDYYLLPEDMQSAYLRAVPAAEAKAKTTVTHSETPVFRGNRSAAAGGEAAGARKFNRSIRPSFLEPFPDQQVGLRLPFRVGQP